MGFYRWGLHFNARYFLLLSIFVRKIKQIQSTKINFKSDTERKQGKKHYLQIIFPCLPKTHQFFSADESLNTPPDLPKVFP